VGGRAGGQAAPIIADAEAGFGGALYDHELMMAMIAAARFHDDASAVHGHEQAVAAK
jgi:isocitrate lyase